MTTKRSKARRSILQQALLVLVLCALWIMLWDQFTVLNIVTGLVLGILVTRWFYLCLLYTSPSPRDATLSRMPSSA